MSRSSTICPACGASLSPNSVLCGYCGSRILPVVLSMEVREKMSRLVMQLNADLAAVETRLRRWTTGISILVWITGLFLLVLFWSHFQLLQRIWLFITLLSVISLGLHVFLLQSWAVNRLIAKYRREIDPRIGAFIRQSGLPRWQFDKTAAFMLDEDAPLRQFLKVQPVSSDS